MNFDWSSITRDQIYQHLVQLEKDIVCKNQTQREFHKKITDHLKNLIPVRTRFQKSQDVEIENVWVGGKYYSSYDQQQRKCIEVILCYSFFENQVKLQKSKFKNFCYLIADSILHEVIHMRQFRRRNFKELPAYKSTANKTKVRKEQSYLGCRDEIDAYSFNIACELYTKFNGDKEKIILYLNKQQNIKQGKYNSWKMYLKAFQNNHNHPIIHRVKKKVVHYIPFAEIGKPYKNKDWIDS